MSDDYEVGYGKPPKKTQFKKGQSGCPTGRPKKVKNLKTIVHEEAYSKVEIKEAGKKRKVTKVVALFKRMMAKGIQGDVRAASIALTLLREYLPQGDPDAFEKAPLTEEELKILIVRQLHLNS